MAVDNGERKLWISGRFRFGGVSEWWGCCKEQVGQAGGAEAAGRAVVGLERGFNIYSFTKIDNFSFSLI